LALVLNDLLNDPKIKDSILKYLNKFYRFTGDLHTEIKQGTIDTILDEFSYSIPTIRLSDGTLRFLCLAAILCHPEPPPLICIEDPEIGLHPDALPIVADMLKQAAEKTQIIVTTQSEVLVSAFSDMPEAVLVCEKDDSGTSIHRLEAEKLSEWLEDYSLGTLWQMGEIGGNP
jgi:predicted ATPase